MTAGYSLAGPLADTTITAATPVPANPRRRLLGLPLAGLAGLAGRTGRLGLIGAGGTGLLAACSPRLDWREARLPGGEVLVQLPGRPASMTRHIHLRQDDIEMTMVGAEIHGLAFTVAIARGKADISEEEAARHLDDMREQMLRNIATTFDAATERRTIALPVLDANGTSRGTREASFIDANGARPHEKMRMQAAFFVVRKAATQAVVIGQPFDEAAARQFFDSIRIVEV